MKFDFNIKKDWRVRIMSTKKMIRKGLQGRFGVIVGEDGYYRDVKLSPTETVRIHLTHIAQITESFLR